MFCENCLQTKTSKPCCATPLKQRREKSLSQKRQKVWSPSLQIECNSSEVKNKIHEGTNKHYHTCIKRRIAENAITKNSWGWFFKGLQNFPANALNVDITVVVTWSIFSGKLFPVCSWVPRELLATAFILWCWTFVSEFSTDCPVTCGSIRLSWSMLGIELSAHQKVHKWEDMTVIAVS